MSQPTSAVIGGCPTPGPTTEGPAQAYAQFFRPVWRSLRRLGVPESAVEDAAQDVFLVVYRRWGEFLGRSTLSTWIYGIVLRVAQDHRRAVRRHAARVERAAHLPEETSSLGADPEAEMEQREAARRLHHILDQLDDDQRTVLVLVALEGLAVSEVAAAIGINVNTCHSRLRLARKAFETMVQRSAKKDGRHL